VSAGGPARRAPRSRGAASSTPPVARRPGCSPAAAPPTRPSRSRSRSRAGRGRRATSSAEQPGTALSPPTPASGAGGWPTSVPRACARCASGGARWRGRSPPGFRRWPDTRPTGTVAPSLMGKAPTRDVEPGRLLHLASPLMTGPDVKALQKLQSATGYGKGIDEDGESGPMTAQAVYRAKFWLGFPRPSQLAGGNLNEYLA